MSTAETTPLHMPANDTAKAESSPPAVLPQAPRYDRRIISAMRKLMQSMDTHSRRLMKQYDITVPQVVCLYELYEKGAMTVVVLSRNAHISSSTTVGVIDRLEEKGLVKRTRDTEDRRAVFVDITEKGREFVRSAPQLLHNQLSERLNALCEDEQIILANSLDMLVHLVEGK